MSVEETRKISSTYTCASERTASARLTAGDIRYMLSMP
jgi:hypothetical protein